MDKSIFWLASFPKSGNTLLRSILSSLFFTKDGNFDLETLKTINQFERTDRILKNKKLFNNDLYNLNKTPILYKYIRSLQTKKALELKEDFTFLKTHSGLFEIGGNAFTNKENTRGIIYVVRDPRDVCISWSKYLGISIDDSIENMISDFSSSPWAEPDKEIFEDKHRPKYLLSSWEKHVQSWTSINWDVPLKIIKFEDMVYDKKKILYEIIEFFEKNYNFKFQDIKSRVNNIVISTDFKKLKQEEKSKGFFESSGNSNFFSVGEKNQWINKLEKKQIEKLENKLGHIMKRFNYKLNVEF